MCSDVFLGEDPTWYYSTRCLTSRPSINLEQTGYHWHWLHPFTFDDCISLLYGFDRLPSWERPLCFVYSHRIMKWKLYQNFLIIQKISNPQSSEFMYRKNTDAMDLQRPDLNLKPSCSKSRSIQRDGNLNVTSAHDVFVDHCYTTTSGCCHHRINC